MGINQSCDVKLIDIDEVIKCENRYINCDSSVQIFLKQNIPNFIDIDEDGSLYMFYIIGPIYKISIASSFISKNYKYKILAIKGGINKDEQFSLPIDICVINRQLYVADYYNHCIQIINRKNRSTIFPVDICRHRTYEECKCYIRYPQKITADRSKIIVLNRSKTVVIMNHHGLILFCSCNLNLQPFHRISTITPEIKCIAISNFSNLNYVYIINRFNNGIINTLNLRNKHIYIENGFNLLNITSITFYKNFKFILSGVYIYIYIRDRLINTIKTVLSSPTNIKILNINKKSYLYVFDIEAKIVTIHNLSSLILD